MSDGNFIHSLSAHLRQRFGLACANKILLRVFLIEKSLKRFGLGTIDTKEFFFILFFVFNHLVEYFLLSSKKYGKLHLVNVMELASYFTYSYFGPTVEYKFSLFVPDCLDKRINIDWQELILDLITTTDLPQKFLQLNIDNKYYQSKLNEFLF